MRVRVGASSAVHIKDKCVQGLLVVQGKRHSIQTTSPVLPTWFLQQKSGTCIRMRTRKCIYLIDNGLKMSHTQTKKRHSGLTAIVWSKIRPPLMFWYSSSFSACSLSFTERSRKKLENFGKATSSLSKYIPFKGKKQKQKTLYLGISRETPTWFLANRQLSVGLCECINKF